MERAPVPPSIPAVRMAERGQLDRRVVPVRQAVSLRLDPERPDYTGAVRIDLEVAEPVRSFRLHALGMSFTTAAAGGLPLTWKPVDPGSDTGLVELTAERELAPGRHRLEIAFSNPFNPEKSGLFQTVHNGRSYLFTQFEELYARTAFPCWDEPAFKIPFQLTLEVPEGCEALSNTPVETDEPDPTAAGWRRLVFCETPPLPTYLVALAVGPLESVPVPGLAVPARVVTVQGQSHLTGLAAELLPPILAALEEYFGSPYPYEKLDLVAVPEFWWGAMEHPGAVTYRDSLLLIDPRGADPKQRRLLVRATTHELAHMWFGNLVTIEWWDELWLKESFADWVADKLADQTFPTLGVGLVELEAIHDVMTTDARLSTKPIRKPVAAEVDVLEDNSLVYLKGKAVLGMLEQWVGAEVFRRGVRDYLTRHAWSTARAADLWEALSRASGHDVEAVLRTYLDQPGLPLVDIEETPGGGLEVRQRRFLTAGVPPRDQTWQIPVGLKLADAAADGGAEARTLLLLGERARLDLGLDFGKPRGWVFPDLGGRGYYRWRLPTARLMDLAARASSRLDTRERVGFLGNATALLRAGEIGGGDYLEILGAFAADPEPLVVSMLLSELRETGQTFVSGSLEEPFAAFVRQTLRPAVERWGLRRNGHEDDSAARLRGRLLSVLGREGRDPEARRYAGSLAAGYLEDEASVDPALVRAALTVAAAAGDAGDFERYRRGFETATVPGTREHYLAALAALPGPELQERALTYALTGPTYPAEVFLVGKGVRDTAAGREVLHRWALDHFHEFLARIPRKYGACILIPLLATGGSLERLDAVRSFFSRPENQVEGWRAELAKAEEEVGYRAALRRRESAAVAAWLAQRSR